MLRQAYDYYVKNSYLIGIGYKRMKKLMLGQLGVAETSFFDADLLEQILFIILKNKCFFLNHSEEENIQNVEDIDNVKSISSELLKWIQLIVMCPSFKRMIQFSTKSTIEEFRQLLTDLINNDSSRTNEVELLLNEISKATLK